jgi:hypothetical protein
MTKVASGYGPDHRVNIVKKIKVDGAWNFYPAVVESNGKLKDKVRIKGTVEVDPEGAYYLQWREGKSRLREPVPDRTDVLDLARRKYLEIEAAKAGVLIAEIPEQASPGIMLADAATGSGKRGLHRGKTAIEGRTAQCVSKYGRDNEQCEEAEELTNPVGGSPSGNSAPNGGCEQDNHRHLQRPGKAAICRNVSCLWTQAQ